MSLNWILSRQLWDTWDYFKCILPIDYSSGGFRGGLRGPRPPLFSGSWIFSDNVDLYNRTRALFFVFCCCLYQSIQNFCSVSLPVIIIKKIEKQAAMWNDVLRANNTLTLIRPGIRPRRTCVILCCKINPSEKSPRANERKWVCWERDILSLFTRIYLWITVQLLTTMPRVTREGWHSSIPWCDSYLYHLHGIDDCNRMTLVCWLLYY